MDYTACRNFECPEMSLGRLVSHTGDWYPEILAEQQRPNTTMGYKPDALTQEALKDIVHSSCHSGLGINRTFPASHALLRPREEFIRHPVKLRRWKKPGRTAIILMQPVVDANGKSEVASQDASGLDRFGFGARPYGREPAQVSLRGKSPHPMNTLVR
jgi:hypothetical protein